MPRTLYSRLPIWCVLYRILNYTFSEPALEVLPAVKGLRKLGARIHCCVCQMHTRAILIASLPLACFEARRRAMNDHLGIGKGVCMRAVSGVNPDVGMAHCQFRVGSSICCSRQYTVLLGQAALTDASRHYARPLVTPFVLMPRADHSRLPKSCADADVLPPISASDTVAHLHELVPIHTSTQSLTLNHQTISGPLQTTPSYYEKKRATTPSSPHSGRLKAKTFGKSWLSVLHVALWAGTPAEGVRPNVSRSFGSYK